MPLNFYRVEVTGWTLLSSSRYISGYFDESAVNTYFSEYTQPTQAHFDPTGPTTKPADEKATGLAPLAGGSDNKALVLLLSSNSDEIANGISTLAQSSEVTDTLIGLVGRDRLEAARTAKAASDAATKEGTALQTLATDLLAQLDPATDPKPTPDQIEQLMLAYANRLASFISPGKTFKDFNEASAWVSANSTGVAGK